MGHLLALTRPVVTALALVSPPLALYPPPLSFDALVTWRKPTLLVVGDADDFCPLASFEALSVGEPSATQRVVVREASHFWAHGTHAHAAAHVASWASFVQIRDKMGE